MEAAEEWHIPPWQVEEQATQEWWDRWVVMRQERAKTKQPKGGFPKG